VPRLPNSQSRIAILTLHPHRAGTLRGDAGLGKAWTSPAFRTKRTIRPARSRSPFSAVRDGDVTTEASFLCRVRSDWVDHYGHMNLAYYLVAFDMATDEFWPALNLGEGFRARGLGTFAVESWQAYVREVVLDMPLAVESAVLAFDSKRLLLRHRLYHAEKKWLSAENEVLFLCVNLDTRRVAAWPDDVVAKFQAAQCEEAPKRLTLRRG
jgi:acyl-CoA thioester hydrolase